MSFDPLTGALDLGAKLVDRLIPDPAAKAQAAAQLLQLKASGELARMTADTDLARAQIEVNKAEATSASLFVAGDGRLSSGCAAQPWPTTSSFAPSPSSPQALPDRRRAGPPSTPRA